MSESYILVDVSVLPPFLLAVLVMLLAPGPDMAFMVASGLNGGRWAAVRAALGITVGVSVYVVLTALGLGALLAAAPAISTAIQLAGAVYLAYLAWSTWGSSTQSHDLGDPGTGHFFRRGFLVNLANPKVVLFFTALLPQFLGGVTADPTIQLLMLGLVLQALGLVVDLVIGLSAGALRDRVLNRPGTRALMERLSAGVYAALAIGVLARIGHELLSTPAPTR